MSLKRTDRLRQVERLLFDHPNGWRIIELANFIGVNRRTIYRDIEALKQKGVPIWQDAGRFGIVRTDYRHPVHLDAQALTALIIGTQNLAALSQHQNLAAGKALQYLADALPLHLAALARQRAKNMLSETADAGRAETLEAIAEGWMTLRTVRLWYGGETYTVSIYILVTAQLGDIYAVGIDEHAGALRAFRLTNIQRARLLNQHYTMPNPDDLGSDVFPLLPWPLAGASPHTEIKLHFAPGAAPLRQDELIHPSQRLEPMENGGFRLTLHVDDIEEVYRWVLGYGASVEVIAPAALRERLLTEARHIRALYEE